MTAQAFEITLRTPDLGILTLRGFNLNSTLSPHMMQGRRKGYLWKRIFHVLVAERINQLAPGLPPLGSVLVNARNMPNKGKRKGYKE
jgi:hypothetical protein